MKKIIVTLIACSLIGIAAQSQTQKAGAPAQPSTKVQVIKDLNSALDATNLNAQQKSNCKEYLLWAKRKKQSINSDANLSTTDKAAKIAEVESNLNVRLAKMMSPAEIKLITPYMN